MKFRSDVNGLRAIAVIGVVLFHFGYSSIPGGFAGVDVFFVISGFLMTSIIFSKIDDNKFSITDFYASRANRIIPVLFFVSLALIIIGWFYLPPTDYKMLGKHIEKSILFLSNIRYMNESGYFAVSSHTKWLLHTWSLSVEWQFYILYPAVLLCANKFLSLKNIKRVVLLLLLISFSMCIYYEVNQDNRTYFMLSTRMWEMLFGGLAFLYPFKIKNPRIVSIIGLGLVIISFILFSKNNIWPSYLTITPVLGAYLIILANAKNIILDNKISQKIGEWSYSIYLWHWPVVVMSIYFKIRNWQAVGVLLSLCLGALSYYLIEKNKCMTSKLTSLKSIYKFKPILMILFIFVLSKLICLTDGFHWHYSNEVLLASNESFDRNKNNLMLDENSGDFSVKILGNSNNIKAIMVGDSHADAIATALSTLFDLKKEGVTVLARASCPFIMNVKISGNSLLCLYDNSKRMEYINKHPSTPVFIAARMSAYLYGQSNPERVTTPYKGPLIYFKDKYHEVNKKFLLELEKNIGLTIDGINNKDRVFIISPIPEMHTNIPKAIAKEKLLYNDVHNDFSISIYDYEKRNKQVNLILKNVTRTLDAHLLSPINYLCKQGKCISNIHGRPIYYDGDHMSEFGNKLLTPMFRSALDDRSS
ncbi:hypothetical protein NFHSH190041_25150 [Shewanella sp. NFH-SH190041]|nr:hypothetical protein NFHSH190041_25150 [Shewanella sp. NFH-SH190041]